MAVVLPEGEDLDEWLAVNSESIQVVVGLAWILSRLVFDISSKSRYKDY